MSALSLSQRVNVTDTGGKLPPLLRQLKLIKITAPLNNAGIGIKAITH